MADDNIDKIIDLLKQAGFDDTQVHPTSYRNFEPLKFVRLLEEDFAAGFEPLEQPSTSIDPIRAVAFVVEQLEGNEARIRWMNNSVPEGSELLWDHSGIDIPEPVIEPVEETASEMLAKRLTLWRKRSSIKQMEGWRGVSDIANSICRTKDDTRAMLNELYSAGKVQKIEVSNGIFWRGVTG